MSTLMPVPPLEEQKRTVVMLGCIFPIIDAYSKCKTELDLYNTTFPERLKKSILQEAAQEFYTNRTVVYLMTEMLKPESGESIYDIKTPRLIQFNFSSAGFAA